MNSYAAMTDEDLLTLYYDEEDENKANEAFAELERGSGSQFDPSCVAAFLRLRPRIEELLAERSACTMTVSWKELKKTRALLALP